MSIFRPPKTKPRQFNYIPRHYDPVKEERDRRRREMYGTSADDDTQTYAPGKYIRTQREAREATQDERGSRGIARMRTMLLAAVALVVVMMVLLPRITLLFEYGDEGAQSSITAKEELAADSIATPSIVLYEQHGDIDFREFETLSPEIINEIEEWQNSVGEITIYDDDVEIVDGVSVDR